MNGYKLKIKIGDHEFEAEGPTEVVQQQFAAFRELVETLPKAPQEPHRPTDVAPENAQAKTGGYPGELLLERIMRADGRIISLTARAASLEEEILLVLLGQRNLRNNESVTGGEIMDGLKRTGRTVRRIDYQLDKMTTAGDIITIGVGRARRYRMTNQGFAKAQELAMGLVQRVA
jgi:hypothetical protein